MKKTYSSPVVKELHMDTEQMVAESLAINSSVTVDGGDALVKGNEWDIFGEYTVGEE
ncbi:MAG: hypothetical protein IJT75_10090 [Bacteroidaceae bacterium]|nr:hypothetical protein [Bacteroidaceae bacterium]